MKRLFLPLLLLTCGPVLATWVPTADSTTSAPKFTDGNFVISWSTGNRRFSYVSHDPTVSTVCDMTTFCTDVDGVSGYRHPTRAASSAFSGKSGVTRVVLPEECESIYLNAFTGMPDLESVVLPSNLRWVEALGNHRQIFSACPKLSTVTPRGVAETNGVAYFGENIAQLPPNTFQDGKGTALKHVIAPWATLGGDAMFQNCYGLETVTLKDLTAIHTFAFQYCRSLTNVVVLSRKTPFAGVSSFSGTQHFQGCSAWSQPLDFSAATFTTFAGVQVFNGCTLLNEVRLPATLTSLGKQVFRDDGHGSGQRRFWFYGPPPTFYWASNDPDYIFYAPANPRQILFVPEAYAVAWTNALSNHGTWTAITDTDRARADYPTKLEDVQVKAIGPKYDLVPAKVKDSDVLGLSTEGCAGRPYYVVQWREAAPGTLVTIK